MTALTGVGTRIARMESRGGPEWLSRPRGNTRRTAVNCLEEERDVSEQQPEMYPTHGEIEAAAEVFRNAGVDIHLPWEGDLDDREREIFEALRDALMAAERVRRQGSGA